MQPPCDGMDFTVTGFSMRFFLVPGDRVRVRRVPVSTLQVGDIIVFLEKRREEVLPVVHRLIWKGWREGSSILWTKGDACARLDSAVSESSFIGKVTAIEKKDGSWRHLDGYSGRLEHLAAGLGSSLFYGGFFLAHAALWQLQLRLSRRPALYRLRRTILVLLLFTEEFSGEILES